MKERPILFSAPMIRAILQGRKTQTRRVIKPQPSGDCNFMESASVNEAWQAGFVPVKCPYGKPGDRLWVRETWKPDTNEMDSCITYKADGFQRTIDNTQQAADRWIEARRPNEQWPKMERPSWRPSIHMPRWASRITLDIVNVRVERLNDISEQDALAEGIEPIGNGLAKLKRKNGDTAYSTPQALFWDLWESINGAGSWSANPWVWVIEFKRAE